MREASRLLKDIPTSVTVSVNDKAHALKASGKDIIALAGGDPDYDTPCHVSEAAIRAINAGKTHYPSPTKGLSQLTAAIADKTSRDNGFEVDPRTDVVVTPGCKWALFLALSSVLNPGDEVLYFEPVWVSYPTLIRINGGVPVAVRLSSESDFAITADLIRRSITPKTKALMVNSPNNPTGRVLTRQEVDAIVEIAIEADLYVIADEVYEKIIFDGRKHYSLAAEPGMAIRTLTANGLSKGYAMTGWRLGWLVGPPELMRLAIRMHGHSITSAATFTMVAAVEALNGPQESVEQMRKGYQDRRDYMVTALNEIEGVDCYRPDGTFYLMPRFPSSLKNSLQLSEELLELAGIAATPGIAFGASAEGFIRFSIATRMEELERAVEHLGRVASLL